MNTNIMASQPEPEVEPGPILRCEECEAEFDADPDTDPLYECGECGAIFTGTGSNRCEDCGRFASKVGDQACPECEQGALVEVEE